MVEEKEGKDQQTRVVITSFVADPKAGNLGRRVPINLGTRFELAFKETEWIYDQSDTLNPVVAKFDELGLTTTDIFADDALAARVRQTLNADLILVGQLNAPRIRRKDFDQPVKRQRR